MHGLFGWCAARSRGSRGPAARCSGWVCGQCSDLAGPPQLLQQCRLVERILASWEENERVQ